MEAGVSPAQQARTQYRHELRTLTYVTIDQANGGIVRNLTRDGIGVQVVAAVRPKQQLRVRFELRYPRLRVETRGEVVWATFSGQCGIRFLDLPPKMERHISEWIFGNLLEGAMIHPERGGTVFTGPETDDGLLVSPAARNVIELPRAPEFRKEPASVLSRVRESTELDWLSQPLSGKSLAWTVNALVIVASVLLFALVFLSIARSAPPWPVSLTLGGIGAVSLLYWGFFKIFGGLSPGERLARLAQANGEDANDAARFR
jgi:hypothetical protein